MKLVAALSLLLALAACAAAPEDGCRPAAPNYPPCQRAPTLGALLDWCGPGVEVLIPRSPPFERHVPRALDGPSRDALDAFTKTFDLESIELGPCTRLIDESPVIETDALAEGTLDTLLQGLAAHGELNVVLPALEKGRFAGARRGERWSTAFARICSQHGLHAARFGTVIAVSEDPIAGGSPLEDPDSPRASFDAIAGQLEDARVTIDAEDTCLGNIVAKVAERLGRRVRFDTPVVWPLTLHVKNVSAVFLLRWLVREAHVHTALEGNTLVVSQPEERFSSTIVLKDAPSAGALRLLARGADRELVVEGRLGGKISCELHDVKPLDALRAVAAALRCSLAEGPSTVVVASNRTGLEDLEGEGPRRYEGLCDSHRLVMIGGTIYSDKYHWPDEWPFGD